MKQIRFARKMRMKGKIVHGDKQGGKEIQKMGGTAEKSGFAAYHQPDHRYAAHRERNGIRNKLVVDRVGSIADFDKIQHRHGRT